jgi:hypothetical protein
MIKMMLTIWQIRLLSCVPKMPFITTHLVSCPMPLVLPVAENIIMGDFCLEKNFSDKQQRSTMT